MENIPKEIIKLIALNLVPGFLSMVCKTMNIYDEAWYYDYLIMRYDRSEIVDRVFSFKELYARSLEEGPLYILYLFDMTETNLKINAIKAAPDCYLPNRNYVLKFNGDLCLTNNNAEPELLDSGVIDIGLYCYIKQTKIYIYKFCYGYLELNLPPIDSKILNIQNIGCEKNNFICQFNTINTIFFTIYNGQKYQIRTHPIKYNIIKAYTNIHENKCITYILSDNNIVLIYYDKNFNDDPIIINNVNDIGKKYIRINKIHYFLPYNVISYHLVPIIHDKYYTHAKVTHQLISDKKIAWIDQDGYLIKFFEVGITIKKLFGDIDIGKLYCIKQINSSR